MGIKERIIVNSAYRDSVIVYKQPSLLKDTATLADFQRAVNIVEERDRADPFVKSRDIITLLLLFLTGVKISHILNCTANTLRPLIDGGTLSIPAHKRTGHKNRESGENTKIEFVITKSTQKLAYKYKEHIERICEGKKGAELVITAKNKTKSLERSFMDHKINKILKQASPHKNLTSHSFRMAQVAHLIQASGISAAQKLMGHKDVRTTNSYDKREISLKQLDQLYEQLAQDKSAKSEKGVPPSFAIGKSHTKNKVPSSLGRKKKKNQE